MFLKVEPPSEQYREESVLFIDTDEYPIDYLILYDWLMAGELFDSEDVFNDAIANAPGPGTEEATNRIREESMWGIVELLNYVVGATHREVSERSTFQLVSERDE